MGTLAHVLEMPGLKTITIFTKLGLSLLSCKSHDRVYLALYYWTSRVPQTGTHTELEQVDLGARTLLKSTVTYPMQQIQQ